MTNCRYFVSFLVVVLAASMPWLLNQSSSTRTKVRALEQLKSYVQNDLNITIPVELRFGDQGFVFPDLVEAAQLQIDLDIKDQVNMSLSPQVRLIDMLDVKNITVDNDTSDNDVETDDDKYVAELLLADENAISMDASFFKAYLFYSLAAIHANDLPFYVAQAVNYHLLAPEIEVWNRGLNHSFDYSPHLNFNVVYFGDNEAPDLLVNATRHGLEALTSELAPFTNITVSHHHHTNDSLARLPAHLRYSSTYNYNLFVSQSSPIQSLFDREMVFIDPKDPDASTDDIEAALHGIEQEIKHNLHVPETPSNNTPLKLASLARYNTLLGVLASLDLLIASVQQHIDVHRPTMELYAIIDSLEQSTRPSDWFRLLHSTWLVHQSLSSL